MDRKQPLLKALAEAPDEANADDVLMRLFDLFRIEKGIAATEDVTPRKALYCMGKWLKEPYYFEMFRRHYHYLLPTGRIEYRDKPDFILHGSKKTGIEITNFYLEDGSRTDSEQRQRVMRNRVVSEARSIYLDNGGRRITLFFSFDKRSPIVDQRQLAERIAKLAKRIDRRQTGTISKDVFYDIPELSFIYLIAEECPNSQWKVQQVYDGSVLSRDKLLEIVRTKELKALNYEHCDAYWLVVFVDFMDPAQDQEIRVDGFQKIDSSRFEKVLVYKTLFHHVLEAT